MLYDVVKRAGRCAGVSKLTPHALRRTFITILDERGVPLADLQLAVSHESITTTERYRMGARAAGQAPGELLRDLVEQPASKTSQEQSNKE